MNVETNNNKNKPNNINDLVIQQFIPKLSLRDISEIARIVPTIASVAEATAKLSFQRVGLSNHLNLCDFISHKNIFLYQF